MGLSSGRRTRRHGSRIGRKSPRTGRPRAKSGSADSSARECGVELFLSWPGLTKQKPISLPQRPCSIRIKTGRMPLPYTQDPRHHREDHPGLGIFGYWVRLTKSNRWRWRPLPWRGELEHPFHSGVCVNVSFLDLFHHSGMRREHCSSPTKAVAVSTKHSFELGLSWATVLQGWALAEQGREEGLRKLTQGSPLLRRQAQVSTTRLFWRCSPKYIYGTTALTKAWAPLRTRRSLLQHGESAFGKQNYSG